MRKWVRVPERGDRPSRACRGRGGSHIGGLGRVIYCVQSYTSSTGRPDAPRVAARLAVLAGATYHIGRQARDGRRPVRDPSATAREGPATAGDPSVTHRRHPATGPRRAATHPRPIGDILRRAGDTPDRSTTITKKLAGWGGEVVTSDGDVCVCMYGLPSSGARTAHPLVWPSFMLFMQ